MEKISPYLFGRLQHEAEMGGGENEKGMLTSVTRLGALLDFGQDFKAFGNNYFAEISHIHRHFL